MEPLKMQVISGLFWKLMERGGTQIVQFIIQIFLARLLLPRDYGIIALITIFLAIAGVFVQGGFSTALIQKKKVDEIDYSSVFYLCLAVSVVLYIGLFFTAPLIADFYHSPQLILVLRILSLTLFFGAVNAIQEAVVSRTMQFKRFFFSSLGGILVSGAVGIAMAMQGFGVWALVGQQLVNNLLITSILWFTVAWRPKLSFSWTRISSLFSFGWKIMFSSLLATVYSNLYGLVIGRIFSSEMLAYYNRGNQLPHMIVTNIDGSISNVMLPVLSVNQDDHPRVKELMRRSIVTSSFVIFPAMAGLAACAEPLVKIVLTDKWLPSVPFLQIMCLTYALWPIQTANLQAINALGRSDIFLKLEIIKKFIGVAILCVSVPFGIYVMVAFKPVGAVIAAFINAYPNKKLLNYSYKEQWLDIMPSFILSLVMGAVVAIISFGELAIGLALILKIIIGAVVYITLAYIFKLECFTYLLATGKDILINFKGRSV